MKPDVVITKCNDYVNEEVYKAVKESVDLLGGIRAFVKKGERILLKPNLLSAKPPDAAVTTHPAVVRAVIQLVQEAGACPVVGHSPGMGSAANVAQKCGIAAVAKEFDVDVVVESTGLFVAFDKAAFHLTQGAKKVVITAPAKENDSASAEGSGETKGETILMSVNEDKFGTCDITSNASCTTNSASPVIAILDEAIGIEKAILSTTHAYTTSQSIVDGPSKKDMKEGRAAAQNIVPTSTGAAIAVGQELGVSATQLSQRLTGFTSPAGRFEIWQLRRGITLVDDAYNANPDSMQSAITSLQDIASVGGSQRRRVAVLGGMRELGAAQASAHREVGQFLRDKVDLLVAIGPDGKLMADASGLPDAQVVRAEGPEAMDFSTLLRDNDAVLVKASRYFMLDKVAEKIKQRVGR